MERDADHLLGIFQKTAAIFLGGKKLSPKNNCAAKKSEKHITVKQQEGGRQQKEGDSPGCFTIQSASSQLSLRPLFLLLYLDHKSERKARNLTVEICTSFQSLSWNVGGVYSQLSKVQTSFYYNQSWQANQHIKMKTKKTLSHLDLIRSRILTKMRIRYVNVT